jgi:beta-lactamase regulating signal transducer with metallopeptidase domain/HEAT repeat protein
MNFFIDTTVEPVLWLLADWSLRWAVLIGIYAAWLGLFRPRRAALRYPVGLGVLLACVLLTAGPRWGSGFARWPAPATAPPRTAEAPLPSSAMIPEGDPAEVNSSAATPEDAQPDLSPSLPSEHRSVELSADTPASEALGSRRLLCLIVAGSWLAGVALMLARLGIGFLVLGRLRRTAVPASEESLRLLAVCRAELGLGRRVCLAVHARVHSPITLGLFHPIIVVPPAWSELPEAARRGSLLHELAHLARHDDWTVLLLELVRAGFFFHPLVHWLLAWLERDRELLCDEAAVAHGVAPAEYARMLVAFARHPGRLSPGISLPVGGSRTVQVRIHHLLEDTMNRPWRPLSRASAAMLALAVLGLALGLGSFRVRAIDPKPQPAVQVADEPLPPAKPKPQPEGGDRAEDPKPPAVKREWLTYGGKTFDQWRDILQTELKPELRIEALNALGAFGQHGYGPEAATAIVDLMSSYDVTTQDQQDFKVIRAACQVLGKIGSAALPVLLKEMKAKDRNGRRFAFQAVANIDDFKQIRPALTAGLTDADSWIRAKAIQDLREMVKGEYSQGFLRIMSQGPPMEGARLQKAREAVPIVMRTLKDQDDKVRGAAINYVGEFGKQDQTTESSLVQATKDESANNRTMAYYWLSQWRLDAKTAGSLYLEALKEKDEHVRRNAMYNLGPQAKEAVPALIKQLTSGPKEDQPLVVEALAAIGGDASPALPELSKLYEVHKNSDMGNKILGAIEKIRSDARPGRRARRSSDP